MPKRDTDKLTCPCCQKPRDVEDTPLTEQEEQLRSANADPWRRGPGWVTGIAREGRLQWACKRCLRDDKALRAQPTLQTFLDFPPYFAYFDQERRCEDCEQTYTFTAKEQQFWYEKLKFWVQSQPKQCVACRRARRERAAQQTAQQREA